MELREGQPTSCRHPLQYQEQLRAYFVQLREVCVINEERRIKRREEKKMKEKIREREKRKKWIKEKREKRKKKWRQKQRKRKKKKTPYYWHLLKK